MRELKEPNSQELAADVRRLCRRLFWARGLTYVVLVLPPLVLSVLGIAMCMGMLTRSVRSALPVLIVWPLLPVMRKAFGMMQWLERYTADQARRIVEGSRDLSTPELVLASKALPRTRTSARILAPCMAPALRSVKASDAASWSPNALEALRGLLCVCDIEIVEAALAALAQLAPDGTLEAIARLRQNPKAVVGEREEWRWHAYKQRERGSKLDRLLTAAEACEQAVRARREADAARDTLVRATEGPAEETLVQPAGTGTAEEAQLLRATDR